MLFTSGGNSRGHWIQPAKNTSSYLLWDAQHESTTWASVAQNHFITPKSHGHVIVKHDRRLSGGGKTFFKDCFLHLKMYTLQRGVILSSNLFASIKMCHKEPYFKYSNYF